MAADLESQLVEVPFRHYLSARTRPVEIAGSAVGIEVVAAGTGDSEPETEGSVAEIGDFDLESRSAWDTGNPAGLAPIVP